MCRIHRDTSKVRKKMLQMCFPHRYVLISTLNAKLLGFEHIKELHANDHNSSVEYQAYEKIVVGK